jgi:hypothetical protein
MRRTTTMASTSRISTLAIVPARRVADGLPDRYRACHCLRSERVQPANRRVFSGSFERGSAATRLGYIGVIVPALAIVAGVASARGDAGQSRCLAAIAQEFESSNVSQANRICGSQVGSQSPPASSHAQRPWEIVVPVQRHVRHHRAMPGDQPYLIHTKEARTKPGGRRAGGPARGQSTAGSACARQSRSRR